MPFRAFIGWFCNASGGGNFESDCQALAEYSGTSSGNNYRKLALPHYSEITSEDFNDKGLYGKTSRYCRATEDLAAWYESGNDIDVNGKVDIREDLCDQVVSVIPKIPSNEKLPEIFTKEFTLHKKENFTKNICKEDEKSEPIAFEYSVTETATGKTLEAALANATTQATEKMKKEFSLKGQEFANLQGVCVKKNEEIKTPSTTKSEESRNSSSVRTDSSGSSGGGYYVSGPVSSVGSASLFPVMSSKSSDTKEITPKTTLLAAPIE